MKQKCSKCHILKDLEAFSQNKRGRHGRNTFCRECRNAQELARYNLKKDSILASKTDRNRQKLYGLSPSDYKELVESQDNKCAICKEVRKLVIDHCHKGLEVRGLLCSLCNWDLGMFRDEANLLEQAINYLTTTCTSC